MSGAAGHLQSVWEDTGLTFGEIKDILTLSSDGKLESVSEKIDGINLVFTWDNGSDELRVARSGSDIKNGGMGAGDLASKFQGRGSVEQAFNQAFRVLRTAMSALSGVDKEKIFGSSGTTWYSIEIVYSADPSTINYDSDSIVFHGWPSFALQPSGAVTQVDSTKAIEMLSRRIERMQQAVCLKHWRLHGPAVVQLQKLASGDALRSAINDINTMMSQAGVDDDDTVQNYLFRMMSEEIDERNLQIPHRAKDVVVQRALGVVGSPTLNDIKKMVPKHKHNEVAEVVKRGPELIKSFIAPLEASIRKFSIEVLKGVKSTLINDNDAEVLRLRDHVSKAIRSIELSGNANAMSVLQHEMSKLGSVNNVSSSVEGIVFRYKGKTYKYTGAWAPVHQILALFKYGRKGVPKMSMYGAY